MGDNNENFTYLCNMMMSGLAKLATTYAGNHIAVHTVEYYRSLISDSLQNRTHFLEKLDTEMDEIKGNYDIYQEFFEDWTKEQISVIVIIIQNIDMEKSPEIRSSYVDSILE